MEEGSQAHIDGSSSSEDSGDEIGKGKRVAWTAQEDAALLEVIKQFGQARHWNALAEAHAKLVGRKRSSKSLRLRYFNHLNPSLKRDDWSEAEDALIIKMQASLGNKWAQISRHLPGRTDNAVKNRWNGQLKRRVQEGLADGGGGAHPYTNSGAIAAVPVQVVQQVPPVLGTQPSPIGLPQSPVVHSAGAAAAAAAAAVVDAPIPSTSAAATSTPAALSAAARTAAAASSARPRSQHADDASGKRGRPRSLDPFGSGGPTGAEGVADDMRAEGSGVSNAGHAHHRGTSTSVLPSHTGIGSPPAACTVPISVAGSAAAEHGASRPPPARQASRTGLMLPPAMQPQGMQSGRHSGNSISSTSLATRLGAFVHDPSPGPSIGSCSDQNNGSLHGRGGGTQQQVAGGNGGTAPHSQNEAGGAGEVGGGSAHGPTAPPSSYNQRLEVGMPALKTEEGQGGNGSGLGVLSPNLSPSAAQACSQPHISPSGAHTSTPMPHLSPAAVATDTAWWPSSGVHGVSNTGSWTAGTGGVGGAGHGMGQLGMGGQGMSTTGHMGSMMHHFMSRHMDMANQVTSHMAAQANVLQAQVHYEMARVARMAAMGGIGLNRQLSTAGGPPPNPPPSRLTPSQSLEQAPRMQQECENVMQQAEQVQDACAQGWDMQAQQAARVQQVQQAQQSEQAQQQQQQQQQLALPRDAAYVTLGNGDLTEACAAAATDLPHLSHLSNVSDCSGRQQGRDAAGPDILAASPINGMDRSVGVHGMSPADAPQPSTSHDVMAGDLNWVYDRQLQDLLLTTDLADMDVDLHFECGGHLPFPAGPPDLATMPQSSSANSLWQEIGAWQPAAGGLAGSAAALAAQHKQEARAFGAFNSAPLAALGGQCGGASSVQGAVNHSNHSMALQGMAGASFAPHHSHWQHHSLPLIHPQALLDSQELPHSLPQTWGGMYESHMSDMTGPGPYVHHAVGNHQLPHHAAFFPTTLRPAIHGQGHAFSTREQQAGQHMHALDTAPGLWHGQQPSSAAAGVATTGAAASQLHGAAMPPPFVNAVQGAPSGSGASSGRQLLGGLHMVPSQGRELN